MFKKLGVTGLVLASALAVMSPQVASAHDRDDYRYSRDWRGRDWRERDHRYYARGFYDRFGYWHPYR
jgi:hypothetical protein